jgi:hypothetical protein
MYRVLLLPLAGPRSSRKVRNPNAGRHGQNKIRAAKTVALLEVRIEEVNKHGSSCDRDGEYLIVSLVSSVVSFGLAFEERSIA